jgi:phospholipid/cholesterol/gamma-HCH transport system ATP-binding protein
MQDEKFISIRNLSYRRGERVIFNNISLDIPKGKIVAIMGPSGTGKTTLLRLIGGQLEAGSGSITVSDQKISELTRRQLYQLRKDKMGMLFQSGALFTDLSVFENVAFPLRTHTRLSNTMIRDLVLMKLEAVGLRGIVDLMPSELSGGMARRVALARTIALDPELIFYDEPFTGLDPISMGMIVKLIRELNDAMQLTSLLVTHDVQEACGIADYVCVLSGGSIIGYDTPDNLLNNGSDEVKQFLTGNPKGPVPYHFPAPDYRQQVLSKKSLNLRKDI